MRTAVIAPPPGELFSETNDNSVAILLTYGTARVLLAGDAEAREEYVAGGFYTGVLDRRQRSETTHLEPRFRALLIEGAPELSLVLV